MTQVTKPLTDTAPTLAISMALDVGSRHMLRLGVREDQQVIEALGSGCLQNDRNRSPLYAGKPN